AFEEKYNIPFFHAYGATETTPLATYSRLKSYQEDLSAEEQINEKTRQGILVPGLEMKVIGDDGEIPWDGESMGEVLLKGPWIADEYYKDERSDKGFHDGWFYTGDVATVAEEGTIDIVDRTSDSVPSGGLGLSRVELDNMIMADESAFEAAVIAVPDATGAERPGACVVMHDESKGQTTKE